MSTLSDATSFEPTAHPFRWVVLFGVWSIYLCFGVVLISLAPLVAAVEEDLGFSHSAMGTVLGAWQTLYVLSALPCGILIDRIGTRWGLLLCAVNIAASSALRAWADSYTGMLFSVALLGLGAPLVSVGAPQLISQWFTGRDRGFAMGVYITGPLLGNIFANAFCHSWLMPLFDHRWRAIMLAYAGLVVVLGIVWYFISSHPLSRAVDARRSQGPREPQLRVFLDLMRTPAVRLVLLIGIGVFFYNHAMNGWLPEILRSGGMTVEAAGVWAALPILLAILSALVIPRHATSRRRVPVMLGLLVAAAVAAPLIQVTDHRLLVPVLVLQGIARGSLMTLAVLTLLEIPQVGTRRAAIAGGIFFTVAEVGGVLGPVSVGVMTDATGGFAVALGVIALICVGLMFLLKMLQRAMATGGEKLP